MRTSAAYNQSRDRQRLTFATCRKCGKRVAVIVLEGQDAGHILYENGFRRCGWIETEIEILTYEAKRADCLIVYYESGEYLKGAFIEIGAALAAGTPVYAVGEPLPETSVFRSHPLWRQCVSIEEALPSPRFNKYHNR